MKEYIKPTINEEDIELEDIIAASAVKDTTDGESLNPWNIWK